MNAATSTTTNKKSRPVAKKKATKKVVSKKKPNAKIPDMKDVLSAHAKVRKAKQIFDVAREQSNGRKKEWEGHVADLSALLEDVRKGQGRMF